MAATIAQLELRLQALEDINAIKELKARYLRACDRKQPDTMRDCFVEKGALIEAEVFPSFNDRPPTLTRMGKPIRSASSAKRSTRITGPEPWS